MTEEQKKNIGANDYFQEVSEALKKAKAEMQKIGFDLMWEFTVREYHAPITKRLP